MMVMMMSHLQFSQKMCMVIACKQSSMPYGYGWKPAGPRHKCSALLLALDLHLLRFGYDAHPTSHHAVCVLTQGNTISNPYIPLPNAHALAGQSSSS
jgi:hypothetical protein